MSIKAYSYIRFSTPGQIKGDSLRRQLEATKAYCDKKGLELVENMQDLGLSAFHGKHKSEGALGEFLKLVKQGKIEKGSLLIIENLDRLSREKVVDALTLFIDILKSGIRIVTLQDGQEYDETSITDNWTQLIISITYMARAYEESKTKSERLKATLSHKREMARAGQKKIGGIFPAWLKLDPKKQNFELISDVCHAIETIYKMKLAGMSVYFIEKKLNLRNDVWKPPKTKRNKQGGWRTSYIRKLLYNNRQLIGEFQPHILKDGKRIPDGPPIVGYFPKAIPEELYFEVQDMIDKNAKTTGQGGGKTGKYSNLFTHIAKCGICGAPLHYLDKGVPPKGQKYLQCDASRRKLEGGKRCQAKFIRYDLFEKRFFHTIDELELEQILGTAAQKQKKASLLSAKIDSNTIRLNDIENQISNLTLATSETTSEIVRKTFIANIEKLAEEKEKLNAETIELNDKLESLTKKVKTVKETIRNTMRLYRLLEKAGSDEDRMKIRFQLRSEIKRLVKEIRVIPKLNKKEAYEYFKPKYDEFMKELDSTEDKHKHKVRYDANKKILEKILIEDNVNERQFFGEADIIWNNPDKVDGTKIILD